MMNIGNRPTVDGTSQTIEVHFLDFDQDLYNQNISVSLLKRLRSEQKFPSLDALKTQLHHDKRDTATFVASLR
jgi:riboflavin kinase/FMN adenylyltransferase